MMLSLLFSLLIAHNSVGQDNNDYFTAPSEEALSNPELLCACNQLHVNVPEVAFESAAIAFLESESSSQDPGLSDYFKKAAAPKQAEQAPTLLSAPAPAVQAQAPPAPPAPQALEAPAPISEEDKPTQFTAELGSASPETAMPAVATAPKPLEKPSIAATIPERLTKDPENKSTRMTQELGEITELQVKPEDVPKGKKCVCKKKSPVQKPGDSGNWRGKAKKCKSKDDNAPAAAPAKDDELSARRKRLLALEQAMDEERAKQLELERLKALAEAKRLAEEERLRMEREAKCKADALKSAKDKEGLAKLSSKCASYDPIEGFRAKGASVPQHAPIAKAVWKKSVDAAREKPDCGGAGSIEPKSSDNVETKAMHASSPEVARIMRDGVNATTFSTKVEMVPAGLGGTPSRPTDMNPDAQSGHEIAVEAGNSGGASQTEITGATANAPSVGGTEVTGDVEVDSDVPASAVPGVKSVTESGFEDVAGGGGEELPLEKPPVQVGASAQIAKSMPLMELVQLDAKLLDGPSLEDKMADVPIERVASLLQLEGDASKASRDSIREKMFHSSAPSNTLQLVRKVDVSKSIASQVETQGPPPTPTASLIAAAGAPKLSTNSTELSREEEDLVVGGIVKEEEVASSKCLSKYCKTQNNLNAGPMAPATPTECYDVCQVRNCERKFKVQGWEQWYSCVQTCVQQCYNITPPIVKEDVSDGKKVVKESVKEVQMEN